MTDPLGLTSGIVRLAPPHAAWPALFTAERERLRVAFGSLPVVIEHIGSTAIPGVAAKPILDLMLGRPAESDAAEYIGTLVNAGYDHRGEYGIPGREYFVRDGAAGERTHHLHLVLHDGEFWASHLRFRDVLRGDPSRSAAYVALKEALAARYPTDRESYTEGKTDFIRETLRTAPVP